jgi:hypothetical protein
VKNNKSFIPAYIFNERCKFRKSANSESVLLISTNVKLPFGSAVVPNNKVMNVFKET